MRVLKAGRVTNPRTLFGRCGHCGCEFEVSPDEGGVETTNLVKSHRCPTTGCGEWVALVPVPSPQGGAPGAGSGGS